MKSLSRPAALVAAALVLAACGEGDGSVGADSTTPSAETSSTAESSTATAETSSAPAAASAPDWGSSITLSDNQGYQWTLDWQFSGPPPVKDLTMDPPGQGSAVWDTTSATISLAFATAGRSEPAMGPSEDSFSLAALYPSGGPICSNIAQSISVTQGGGKVDVALTEPTPGDFCFVRFDSGYASRQRGLVIPSIPEPVLDSVVAALADPAQVLLVSQSPFLKSSAADQCTIEPEGYSVASYTVYGSDPGPVMC